MFLCFKTLLSLLSNDVQQQILQLFQSLPSPPIRNCLKVVYYASHYSKLTYSRKKFNYMTYLCFPKTGPLSSSITENQLLFPNFNSPVWCDRSSRLGGSIPGLVTVGNLLYGNERLTPEQCKILVHKVQQYILTSKRFSLISRPYQQTNLPHLLYNTPLPSIYSSFLDL